MKLNTNRIKLFLKYSFLEKVTNVTSASFPSDHTSTAFFYGNFIRYHFSKMVNTGVFIFIG